jgi:hypothetical protein
VKYIGEDGRAEDLVDVLSICFRRSAPWRDPDEERVRVCVPWTCSRHTHRDQMSVFRRCAMSMRAGNDRNMEFMITRLESDIRDKNCSAAASVADANPAELKVPNFP